MGIFESRSERSDQAEGNFLTLFMSGNLDETTNLSAPDLSGIKRLVLDVGQIEGVNSIGIRSWIDWMKDVARPGLEIEFVDVQPSFVFQFNMVVGFFPKNASIRSVYVPLFCDKCDFQKKAFLDFKKGIKTLNANTITVQQLIAKQCKHEGREENCEMEPDYAVKQYLAFIVNK